MSAPAKKQYARFNKLWLEDPWMLALQPGARLDLYGKKSHDIPIIKRSIMRFALSCPAQQARAAEFVAKMRKEKADWVQDIEELLKEEANIAPK